jgi:hypothetical protein
MVNNNVEKTVKAIREVNNRFDEMGRKIGRVTAVTREFNDKIVTTVSRVSRRFNDAGKVIAQTTEDEEIVEKKRRKPQDVLLKGFKKFGQGFKKLGKNIGKKLGFDGGGIAGFIMQFINFGSILQALGPIFAPINALLDIFAGTISQTIQPVIQELFEVFMDPQIIEIMTLLAQIFGQVLVAAIRIVIAVVKKLQEIGVFDFLIAILTAVVEGVTWFADNLDIVWNAIVIGFTAVVDFFIAIGDFFIAVWEGIVSAFETVVNFFIDIWEGVLAFFSGVVKFFDMIWKAIVSGFFAFVNFFIGIINGVIDLLNALDFADVFEDIPRISMLSLPTAEVGGFVKEGGAVIVHDNERILTANQNAGITNNNNARNITVNIEATILDDENTEKLAREVERTMIRVNS